MRVCILGAAGLIGRVLTERLLARNVDVKPVVRSMGNAWSLLRLGISPIVANINDLHQLNSALADCTHIVNCALPPNDQLVRSMSNVLTSCHRMRIERLVHLSSVTVYGECPDPKSALEDGPTHPVRGSYGWYKREQDKMVAEAHDKGLSSVILCIPHVIGPWSRFLQQLIESMQRRRFVFAGSGDKPCNLIDVNNLCDAIELSLITHKTDGRRIFITNGDDLTWHELVDSLSSLANICISDIPMINESICETWRNKPSTMKLIKAILTNPETKKIAKKMPGMTHPLILKVYGMLFLQKQSAKRLCDQIKAKETIDPDQVDIWIGLQQLRNVRHQLNRANNLLGYTPRLTFKESMESFEKWFAFHHGLNTQWWPILQELNMV